MKDGKLIDNGYEIDPADKANFEDAAAIFAIKMTPNTERRATVGTQLAPRLLNHGHGQNPSNMHKPPTIQELNEAIEYFVDLGMIANMHGDQRHYTQILLQHAARKLGQHIVWEDEER